MSQEATTPATRTSRVGKRPVVLPKGVEASVSGNVAAGFKVAVKGPKGSLSLSVPPEVVVKSEAGAIKVTSEAPGSAAPRWQGLTRALIANMVKGVTEGYERTLQLIGTGYRAEIKGKDLVCTLGFSHQKIFAIPAGLNVDIPKDSKGQIIVLTGCDKEVVGQAAATIRGFRPPQPYGGKGVRYKDERVREKAGKAGK
jgi:large subunit ribosomal protein L6